MANVYTRHRTQGGYTYLPLSWIQVDRFGCLTGTYVQGPWNRAAVGTYNEMWDCVTPRFKERSARGEVIINPVKIVKNVRSGSGTFSVVKSIQSSCSSPLTYNTEHLDGPYAYYYTHAGALVQSVKSLISQSDIDRLVAAAATQTWANASGSTVGILQDIAEWKQTARLIPSALSSTRKLLQSITRTRQGLLAKGKALGWTSAQVASALWLQYQYGVRPLVKSVNGVVEAMSIDLRKKRRTYRAKESLKVTDSSEGSASTWSTKFDFKEENSHSIEIRAGILIEEELSTPQLLGVTGGNLLALPWELVPYSFVADWFVNVGDWLYALAPYFGKDPIGSWYTVKQEQIQSWYITGCSINPSSNYTLVSPASEHRVASTITYERFPMLPGPSLTWRPYAVQGVVNSMRGLNALALSTQALGKMLKG